MPKALYRKYRSTSLEEVVGQSHITDILSRSLASGRIAHAYLLTGPRGVGKTSVARILAFAINNLPYDEDGTNLDIIEIDAASNNGVENIRDIIEKVQIAPVAAPKKIYIIDEVHMLSKSAFNALLKTLEEPPEHAVFILATTDADKLPATVVSRTQRFSFRAISTGDAVTHLRMIADKEKIRIDDTALTLIAERGGGSFRDSISLLDQLQSVAGDDTLITRELVEQSLGLAPADLVDTLLHAYLHKDLSTIIATLDESEGQGIQASALTTQLIASIRVRITKEPQLLPLLDHLLDVPKSIQPAIKLLTILGAHAMPKQRTAALQATVPSVSAPIAVLEQQATKESPIEPPVAKTPLPPQSTPRTVAEAPAEPAAVSNPAPTGPAGTLDWEALIEHTRVHFVAIYSVLKKCDFTQDGGNITLYTGTLFWKRKLDDAKHRINLVTAMEQIGAVNLRIETIGTPPPPKDSVAASVAAIMGGGEEVHVDA